MSPWYNVLFKCCIWIIFSQVADFSPWNQLVEGILFLWWAGLARDWTIMVQLPKKNIYFNLTFDYIYWENLVGKQISLCLIPWVPKYWVLHHLQVGELKSQHDIRTYDILSQYGFRMSFLLGFMSSF